MPEFHFRHSGKNGVPATHGLTASDEADAFRRKDKFVAEQGVKYVPGSMQVYRQTVWKKVTDPAAKLQTV